MKCLWTKDRNLINNQSGQMTIFIVLIFQVLFVFFAMVSNIGLVVHEKINLQNSTDIAALYGAQKQAEILNAIAHTNYQIWQSWKMLAFRVRVLGDFGRTDHPLRRTLNNAGLQPDILWPNVNYNPAGGNPSGVYPPVVCVTHPGWMSDNPQNDNNSNICKSSNGELGTTIPQLPQVNIIFPPVDAIVSSIFDNLNDQIQDQCDGSGATNWMIAAKYITTFKFDVYNKLKKMKALKQKLETGLDIEGQPIQTGVEKTLRANLTGASQISSIKWINPFDSLNASYKDNWLRPIRVHPAIYFVNQLGTSGCNGKLTALYELFPFNQSAIPGSGTQSGYFSGSDLWKYSLEPTGSFPPWSDNDLLRSTIGVEKNPWVMVYSGVEVITNARKPFFPVGNSHSLTARAFAQPFGASIGPWAKEGWAAGAQASSGAKVDPNTPEPWIGDGAAPPLAENNVPNYSRYPGDPIGLKSQQALSEIGLAWQNISLSPMKLEYYKFQPQQTISGSLGESTQLSKRLEALYVAPNLYDITYFSIEPNALKLYNDRDGQNLSNVMPDFSDNISSVKGQVADTITRGLANVLPYRVKDWHHLLTSWTASNPSEYETPSSRFGVCIKEVPQGSSPTTGDCEAGGRTGYSVKIVSEDYLKSELSLGGTAGTGQILNPPPGG